MAQAEADGTFEAFCSRLRSETGPYLGRVEYGNLRQHLSVWESVDAGRSTNIALVYETPGGSTDQINVSYDHARRSFTVLEEHEHFTTDVEEVLERILKRVLTIPEKRRETVRAEIRRQVDAGMGRAGVFGHM